MASIVASELKLYKAATMAVDATTANIGGAISATEITGGSIGEVFFTMGSNTSGGGTKTQYEKAFYKNTNASLALTSAVIYLANALDDVTANGTASVVSTVAGDDTTKKVRILGYDASSVAQQEELTMNGVTSVVGTLTFSKIHRVELRLVSSGALTTATGDITITRSAALGIIPATYKTATAEIAFGLVGTLDGSTTTTNSTTAPTGITFAKPRTSATGTAVANSQSLTAGSAQGTWFRWQLAELAKPSEDIEVVVVLTGNTT